jgi:hypothetical protein
MSNEDKMVDERDMRIRGADRKSVLEDIEIDRKVDTENH